MDKSTKIGLTAGAFMACAGAAPAATFTQTSNFATTPSWSTTLNFEGANTALPTGSRLLSVQLQVVESLDSSYVLENTSDVSGVYSVQITDVATLDFPSPIGTFVVTDVGSTSSETVSSGGFAFLGSLGSNTVSSVVFTSGLSAFQTGLSISAEDGTAVEFSASEGYLFLEPPVRSGQVSATLFYNYAPVPEPTTMSLIGVGLAGLAARRRAKKKKGNPVG